MVDRPFYVCLCLVVRVSVAYFVVLVLVEIHFRSNVTMGSILSLIFALLEFQKHSLIRG